MPSRLIDPIAGVPSNAAAPPPMVGDRPLRVMTNVARWHDWAAGRSQVDIRLLPEESSVDEVWSASSEADAVVIDAAQDLLYALCKKSFTSSRKWKLVYADLLLNRPITFQDHIKARVLRLLLSRCDLFVHYFRDLSHYQRWYNVSEERSTFLPFKCNDWEESREIAATTKASDGEFVLSAGRTWRDLPTFVEAMRQLDLPGVLLVSSETALAEHGASAAPSDLPPNVQIVVDGGGRESWIDHLRRARVIVVPIRKDNIRVVGISAVYQAMAMRRPVVLTTGPHTNGLYEEDQAFLVPPADPAALAKAIQTAWADEAGEATRRLDAGEQLALALGGEDRFFRDLLTIVGRGTGAEA